MEEVSVYTKEELKEAMKNGASQIVVHGELADKLHSTKKIATISVAGIAAIIAFGGVVVATGPVGVFAAFSVVTVTGMELAAIMTVIVVGVAVIIALYKDYEVIEFNKGFLKFKKKQVRV